METVALTRVTRRYGRPCNSMFVNWIVSQDGTGMLITAKMDERRDARGHGQTDGYLYDDPGYG